MDRRIVDPPFIEISRETLVPDLKMAIENYPEYLEKARSSREWAIRQHDPERVTDKLLRLYEETLK